jgi:phosphatidylglycerophosphate synthase
VTKKLPFGLIVFRLVMVPAILWIAWYEPHAKYVIGIICYLALISDIFDGIIARHVGVATAKLRLWDSNVDFIFWLSASVCVGICFPALVRQNYFYILPFFYWSPFPILFITGASESLVVRIVIAQSCLGSHCLPASAFCFSATTLACRFTLP